MWKLRYHEPGHLGLYLPEKANVFASTRSARVGRVRQQTAHPGKGCAQLLAPLEQIAGTTSLLGMVLYQHRRRSGSSLELESRQETNALALAPIAVRVVRKRPKGSSSAEQVGARTRKDAVSGASVGFEYLYQQLVEKPTAQSLAGLCDGQTHPEGDVGGVSKLVLLHVRPSDGIEVGEHEEHERGEADKLLPASLEGTPRVLEASAGRLSAAASAPHPKAPHDLHVHVENVFRQVLEPVATDAKAAAQPLGAARADGVFAVDADCRAAGRRARAGSRGAVPDARAPAARAHVRGVGVDCAAGDGGGAAVRARARDARA